MKKLFGVVALAALPVACGTTLPSGPDVAAAPGTSHDASVSSSRRRTVPPPPPTCVPGVPDFIQLTSPIDQDTVTIYATPVIDGDRPTPCFVPTWSYEPALKGAFLSISKDALSATLIAPAGTYVVTVTATSDKLDVSNSIKVVVE